MEQKLTIEEFRKQVKKLGLPRQFKPKSLGLNKMFKLLLHNRWFGKGCVDENLLYQIITATNKEIANLLANGLCITLPFKMGDIELKEVDLLPKIVDGKLVYNTKVDWGKTLDWWYEDEEAYQNKSVIKYAPGKRYILKWDRGNFINKRYFKFTPVRSLSLAIKEKKEDGTILAFKLYD